MISFDVDKIRKRIKDFDLGKLFIEELGWDRHYTPLFVDCDGVRFRLDAVAQKRGFAVYQCVASEDQGVPEYALRRKIERQVAKTAHEHMLIFSDYSNTLQIWQWVKREPGKPISCRDHHFHRNQSGEALIQKLKAITFTLDEEDRLTIVDVASRVQVGFDVERITRRFYDRFKMEHTSFLKFVKGIGDDRDREWYASVMLNRLMFIYFIQRKGFLDGDPNYLRNRLTRVKEEHGRDKFYSFYRYFLLRLFHEGLGSKARSPELDGLLGRVPYLNGGLFELHEIEKRYPDIRIPDKAFDRVFDYFDQYQWHLDDRPLRADNEINPDVLGYIFEKYINQKQMGAYYTREDITGYISQNTVLPFLLETAREHCAISFLNPKGPTVWDLLQSNPDRYIYRSIRYGVARSDGSILPRDELPESVQRGMASPRTRMFDARYNVQQATDEDPIRLVHETWRECVRRLDQYSDLIGRMRRGEIRDINDLVTLNLDGRQFVEDVIDNCEGPELLRAFWNAIHKVTVLDPACGSGAFLFAALNVLESLYEACLNRMESFVADYDRIDGKSDKERFSDFRAVLDRVSAHPNRRYYIFKSIILNNLYGVDIMEEAVEICRLRLFLKLAAEVEPDSNKENLGVEPLPDIDFNIKAGNTLVGYVSMKEVRSAMASKLDVDEAMRRFQSAVENVDHAHKQFRDLQTRQSVEPRQLVESKSNLRRQLGSLEGELNKNLAIEYEVNIDKTNQYGSWVESHMPFHWLVDFFGIMNEGGFDVVIGNPPYVEYSKIKDYGIIKYCTEGSGNLYAFMMERSLALLQRKGRLGMIVPISSVCSERTEKLREIMHASGINCVSTYDTRPSKLFDVDQKLAIWIHGNCPSDKRIFSSILHHWRPEERPFLFERLSYTDTTSLSNTRYFYKIPSQTILSAFSRLMKPGNVPTETLISSGTTKHHVFYQESARYWIKAAIGLPYYARDGVVGAPAHGRYLYFDNKNTASSVFAVLTSNIFYLWFVATCDGFHLTDASTISFPMPPNLLENEEIMNLGARIDKQQRNSAVRKTIKLRSGIIITYDEYQSGNQKALFDLVDEALAGQYGLTESELDEIVNYDIKYRMTDENASDDD